MLVGIRANAMDPEAARDQGQAGRQATAVGGGEGGREREREREREKEEEKGYRKRRPGLGESISQPRSRSSFLEMSRLSSPRSVRWQSSVRPSVPAFRQAMAIPIGKSAVLRRVVWGRGRGSDKIKK
jgi:hypothetical protein